MRKLLVATVAAATILPAIDALAADMPLKAPPVAYVAPSWTGFYLGGELGGGWEREQITIVTNNPGAAFPPGTVLNPVPDSGVLGGVYGGFNYQISNFVVGIDGDYTWANLRGTAIDVSAVNGDIAHELSSVDWVATVTGRLGYALNSNWLLFAKSGWAWAHFNGTAVTNTPAGALAGTTTSGGYARRLDRRRRRGVAVPRALVGQGRIRLHQLQYRHVQRHRRHARRRVSSPLRSAVTSLNMVKGGLAYRF